MSRRDSFTLIELLVVIGIVAILSVAVLLALNPTQLMAQGRDATRLNDLDTLNHALTLYGAEQSNFGSSTVVYVSVPDTSLAPGATSTCANIGLLNTNLPSGWTYQCASSQNLQKTDGTGWLPVNFTQMTSKPLSQLPIDPINTTSSGNYYTYVTSGSQWELTSIAESQKYKSQTNSKTQFQPGLLAQGNNFTISPLFNSQGLVGYWPLDEGTGTVGMDMSGNGGNAVFSGSPMWVSGHINSALQETVNNFLNYQTPPGVLPSTALTVALWENTNSGSFQSWTRYLDNAWVTQPGSWLLFSGTGGMLVWGVSGPATTTQNTVACPGILALNTWQFLVGTYDGTSVKLYVNGSLCSSTNFIGQTLWRGSNLDSNLSTIGDSAMLDEVRLYNRALSASEIQALYNATK